MAIIYKITNKVNGKVYIGETIRSLETRWKEHIHESFKEGHGYNYHLHTAIRKYGTDNFSIEMIDNCPDEERFQLETKYIKQYDTTNPDKGYNTVVEGEGHILIATETILEAWNEGLTVLDTAKMLGIYKATVSNRLHANGITDEEINSRVNKMIQERCGFIVEQYDLNGNFIKEWPSASECGRNGYNGSAISSVCRQEQITAYGYLWKYKNDNRNIIEWVDKVKNKKDSGKPKKPIQQLDLNKNIVAQYSSAAEAAKALNKKDKSNICAAARKHRKAYGYYWEYI